jgi:hypothetical protein
MRMTPPLIEWSVRIWALWAALLACSVAPAGASGLPAAAPGGPGAAGLVSLTLERDCFGCPSGQRLEVRGDGLMVFTETGKARHGTQDRSRQTHISSAELLQLARLLEAEGFRSLQPEYQLADTQDGAWASLEAVFREQGSSAVDQTHRVFAREEAAPPGLQRLWSALDALRDRAGLR